MYRPCCKASNLLRWKDFKTKRLLSSSISSLWKQKYSYPPRHWSCFWLITVLRVSNFYLRHYKFIVSYIIGLKLSKELMELRDSKRWALYRLFCVLPTKRLRLVTYIWTWIINAQIHSRFIEEVHTFWQASWWAWAPYQRF